MEQLKIYLKLYYAEIRMKSVWLYGLCFLLMSCVYILMCVNWEGAMQYFYGWSYIVVIIIKQLTTPRFNKLFYIVPLEIKTLQMYTGWKILIHDMYFMSLTIICWAGSLLLRKEWSYWNGAGFFLLFSFISVFATLDGVQQLAGKRQQSWRLWEKFEVVWMISTGVCLSIQVFGNAEGMVGTILLLIAFAGWIQIHFFALRQCKRKIVWHDYKEPRSLLQW